jgi:hypothetical protein
MLDHDPFRGIEGFALRLIATVLTVTVGANIIGHEWHQMFSAGNGFATIAAVAGLLFLGLVTNTRR